MDHLVFGYNLTTYDFLVIWIFEYNEDKQASKFKSMKLSEVLGLMDKVACVIVQSL